MSTNTAHDTVARRYAGQHYDIARDAIESIDWSGVYPVVDADGALTGDVADAADTRFDICDIVDGLPIIRPQAADAMILRT